LRATFGHGRSHIPGEAGTRVFWFGALFGQRQPGPLAAIVAQHTNIAASLGINRAEAVSQPRSSLAMSLIQPKRGEPAPSVRSLREAFEGIRRQAASGGGSAGPRFSWLADRGSRS